MEQNFFEIIGEVVTYAGGSVALSYTVFKYLTSKWIENKFQERLEKYKVEQQKELEEFKRKINELSNRVSKIHEKEFEVLPQMYSHMIDAIKDLNVLTSAFKQYPDVNKMDDEKLKFFLEQNTFLNEWQKNELAQASDKNKYYQNAEFRRDVNQSSSSIYKLHEYIQKNSLFLLDDLKEKFNEIDRLMWEICVNMDIADESQDRKMKMEVWKSGTSKVEPIRISIEKLVQERLKFDKVL